MQHLRTPLLLLLASPALLAQPQDFAAWPPGTSPLEVGRRVAGHFLQSPRQDPSRIAYPETCTWYGALTFAQLSGDRDLATRLIQRFDPLMTPAQARLIPPERHVDSSVFGPSPSRSSSKPRTPNTWPWAKPSPTASGSTPPPMV